MELGLLFQKLYVRHPEHKHQKAEEQRTNGQALAREYARTTLEGISTTHLYRFYLELALKINLFYYAITGAILSFCFAHTNEPLIRLSLLLPFVMSLAFGVSFVYCASLASHTREALFCIRDTLNLQTVPEVQVLIVFLRIFALLFFLVTATLAWLILGHFLN